jgi:hypothetical protein
MAVIVPHLAQPGDWGSGRRPAGTARQAAPPARRARRTRSARSGMSRWGTAHGRGASTTALTTAGVEPMIPASLIPLAPSGLKGRRRDGFHRGEGQEIVGAGFYEHH